ncbi:MAG: KAP family NTPase [Tepidanaerobacteraceae bacterium]|jgi:predicted KAP-like P-loop ATPase|nr:KAP family NTPase [Tepidanaerobacteraceae bacterium]
MILSDNETCIDMINSKPIAKSIVKLIVDNKDEPITIGVHGDWGAGKSSVLEMIKEELASQESIACIKFNGWKYQGFEDAKIALMESVVTTLIEERSLKEKAKDIIEKIKKNIDWLKVAKGAGSIAVTALTGVPPVTLITDAITALKDGVKDPEKVSGIIEKLGKFSNDSKLFSKESTSIAFQEFQKSFDDLMKKAGISKLVVLIDDLDRCLPEVAIETLEAVRLFMFSKSTAFVIAADEAMIEYAVKKHFPDLPENEISKEFSRRYLEKLVQVPFKIPALGEVEAKTYITLLMISSSLDAADSESITRLIGHALEKIKRPWIGEGITVSEIQSILGDDKYQSVAEQIRISNQISSILSKRSSGNPRQIKRFINTLLLRYDIAHARGYGEDIKLSCLAKLMLLERFIPNVYESIASNLSPDGTSPFIAYLESKKESGQEIPEDKKTEGLDAKAPNISAIESQLKEWENNEELLEWLKIEPLIGEEDLRPYYFASKERKDFFLTQVQSEQIRELVQKLMGSRMLIASLTKEISALSQSNAEMIFDLICSKVQENTDYSNIPQGIDGIRALVELHPKLQQKLIEFIKTFPVATVGAWICSGWEKSITDDNYKRQLSEYIQEIAKNGNTTVKMIAQAVQKKYK